MFRGWPSQFGDNFTPHPSLPEGSLGLAPGPPTGREACTYAVSQYTSASPVICGDVGEQMTSGFYLFLLHSYFAFSECVCIIKTGLLSLRIPFKIGSQRLGLHHIGAHLEGPPWALSEICWESCDWASVKSHLWSKLEKELFRQDCCPSIPWSLQ